MSAAAYWDAAYAQGDTNRSWYQEIAHQSLYLLDRLGVPAEASVIDVGGGASTLVDGLLERGHTDVAVLDLSAIGLRAACDRLGASAHRVQWYVNDLRTWKPDRTWTVWHDRAVLHFLVEPADQEHYRRALTAATATGSLALLGTFALDGPESCTGLPVARHDAASLTELIGPDWRLVADERQLHRTPAETVQPFTWVGFRRER